MTNHIMLETVESIVRSFEHEPFHSEHIKAAMVRFPPRRRVDATEAAYIMRTKQLAEPIGKKCLNVGGRYRMVTVWRPLI